MEMPTNSAASDPAESEMLGHMRFMRRNIHLGLAFTFILLVVVLANDLTAIEMGVSMKSMDQFLFLNPPPILFIALAVSAVLEFYLLRKLEKGLKELRRTRSADTVPGQVRKSITDINYGMVKARERSLRIWPAVAVLFVLYFIGSVSNVAEWSLGMLPKQTLNLTAAMNTVVLFMASVFFWITTRSWLVQRRRLRKLRQMEMTILEDLRIR